MAIRVNTTPVRALAGLSISAGLAKKRKDSADRMQQIRLQAMSLGAAASRQATSIEAAKESQELSIEAAKETRAFTGQTNIERAIAENDQEFAIELLKDKLAAGKALTKAEQALEQEALRQTHRKEVMDHKAAIELRERTPLAIGQEQELAVLEQQREKMAADAQLKPIEQEQGIAQIDTKINRIRSNPRGKPQPTAEQRYEQNRFWANGQWMVFDKDGVPKIAGVSYKERMELGKQEAKYRADLDKVVDLASKQIFTEEQKDAMVEKVFGHLRLEGAPPEKLNANMRVPSKDALNPPAGVQPQGVQRTPEDAFESHPQRQVFIDEGAKIGKSPAQVKQDFINGLQEKTTGVQPETANRFKTFDEITQKQQDKILKKQRSRERSRQNILTGGGTRRFKKQTEEQFIERLRTDQEFFQSILKERKEDVPPDNWAEATKDERKSAFENFKETVQPGEKILTFREFTKRMKKNPDEFRDHLNRGT